MKIFVNTSSQKVKIKDFLFFIELRNIALVVLIFLVCSLKAQSGREFTENTQVIEKNVLYNININPNYNNVNRISYLAHPILENLSKILKNDPSVCAIIYNSANKGNIDLNYRTLKSQSKAIKEKLLEFGAIKEQIYFFSFYEKNKDLEKNISSELVFIDKSRIPNSNTIKDSIKRANKSDSIVNGYSMKCGKSGLSKIDSLQLLKTVNDLMPKQKIMIHISGKKKGELIDCKKVLERIVGDEHIIKSNVMFKLFPEKKFNYIPIFILVINTRPDTIYLTEKDLFLKGFYENLLLRSINSNYF